MLSDCLRPNSVGHSDVFTQALHCLTRHHPNTAEVLEVAFTWRGAASVAGFSYTLHVQSLSTLDSSGLSPPAVI